MDYEVAELHLSVQERIQLAIDRLPSLTKDEVPLDDQCPICITSFDVIADGRAREGSGQDPPIPEELAGVTKLVGCGHVFCRACLVEWIRGRHGTCPSCRDVFSSIRPVSDSDYESSDGDYVPDDEDDEDDGFFDSDDAFMETESQYDDMDVEEDLEPTTATDVDVDVDVDVDIDVDDDMDAWEEEQAANTSMENWGLSDGDGSDSVSEVEVLALSVELPSQDDGAEVYTDSGEGPVVLHPPQDDAPEPK